MYGLIIILGRFKTFVDFQLENSFNDKVYVYTSTPIHHDDFIVEFVIPMPIRKSVSVATLISL